MLNLARYISCFVTIALSVVGGSRRALLGCVGEGDDCAEDARPDHNAICLRYTCCISPTLLLAGIRGILPGLFRRW